MNDLDSRSHDMVKLVSSDSGVITGDLKPANTYPGALKVSREVVYSMARTHVDFDQAEKSDDDTDSGLNMLHQFSSIFPDSSFKNVRTS